MFYDLLLEELKPIYQIDTSGNIRNKKSGKIRKSHLDKDGYLNIVLYDREGDRKNYKVHRLVALTFIFNIDDEKDKVNHKDGVRNNNHVSNLEWATTQENSIHSVTEGKFYNDNKERYELVERIAQMLSEGLTTTEIMYMLGIKGAKKNPDYAPIIKIIHGLRSGRTYKAIRDKYMKEGSTTIEMEFIFPE